MSLNCKLKVDGKDVPINDFVQKILTGTIVGAVSSLKGVDPDWQKVELEIKKLNR
ncbi:MAG: hypothetical protein ACFCUE_13325 [Candidatus Bathyarchaeia archaeon]|jgi:hypothetical protein